MLVLSRTCNRDRRFARIVLEPEGGPPGEIELMYVIDGRAKILVTVAGRETEFWMLPDETKLLDAGLSLYLRRVNGGQAFLGVMAPRSTKIVRAELIEPPPDGCTGTG